MNSNQHTPTPNSAAPHSSSELARSPNVAVKNLSEQGRLKKMASQPQPSLLPRQTIRQNPLFIILMILAFLASFTLFALFSTLQAQHQWQASLSQTASIHIKPHANLNASSRSDAISQSAKTRKEAQDKSLADDLKTAHAILSNYSQIEYVETISPKKSRDLLRAWLGDAGLPADLPIPQILHVQLKRGESLPIDRLKQDFQTASIQADFDNHHHWAKALDQKVRALQLIFVLIFILVFGAILAAVKFAVQAALSHRQKMIDVLHQIGTPPNFTARLFSKRFALTGLQSGSLGSAGAFVIISILSFIFEKFNPPLMDTNVQLLPDITSPFAHAYLFIIVPIVMALLAMIVTWRHIKRVLFARMYS